MLLPIILASIAGLIYVNFGIKIGADVGKGVFNRIKTSDHFNNKQKEDAEVPAILIGLLVGAIWPLLILTVASKPGKNRVLSGITKALLPAPDMIPESPIDVGQKLLALEERKVRLEQEVVEMGQQIEELKANPELNKVFTFPKRF